MGSLRAGIAHRLRPLRGPEAAHGRPRRSGARRATGGGERPRGRATGWCAAALASGLVLAPSSAPAAPIGPSNEPLTVLPLEAGLDDDWVAKTMTLALRQVVLESEESTTNDIAKPFALLKIEARCIVNDPKRLLDEASDLTIEPACLQRIGARLGVKSFLWGHVYHEGGARPRVKLHLWRSGEPDRALSLPFEPQAAGRMAERFYRKLVIPEKSADVRLLSRDSLDGDVFIDGQTRGPYEPELVVSLLPGEHTIEVRRGGKVIAAAKAQLAPKELRQLTLEPPKATTDAGTRPPESPPQAVAPPAGGPARATWGWVALGVGAASLGAGLLVNARVSSLESRSDDALADYRRGVPPGQDVCDAAEAGVTSAWPGAATPTRVERLCSGASTLGVLRSVLYGVGALGVGAGVALLVTSTSGAKRQPATSPSTWQLVPVAGPTFGGLQMVTSF